MASHMLRAFFENIQDKNVSYTYYILYCFSWHDLLQICIHVFSTFNCSKRGNAFLTELLDRQALLTRVWLSERIDDCFLGEIQ